MAPIHVPLIGFLFGFLIPVFLGTVIFCKETRRPFSPGSLLLGATVSIVFISIYITIIGFLGLLKYLRYFETVICALAIIWLVFRSFKPGSSSWKVSWISWAPPDSFSLILLWLILIYQCMMFINATCPFVNQDWEVSHYLFIKEFLRSGAIHIIPENNYSYYPLALEMSVAGAFDIGGPEAANLCFWFMNLLLMGWLIEWGANQNRTRFGYMLTAAVSGIFYLPVIAYSGFIEIGVTLFVIAGFILYLNWLAEKNGFHNFYYAALFLGFACSSKYSALIALILVLMHILALCAPWNTERKLSPKPVLIFFLLLLIPMSFWYGRNLLITGNPTYPFLRSILGGPEPIIADDISTWASWGLPITLKNYLLYPFKMAFFFKLENAPFIRVPYPYMSWLFALAPVAGILLWHRRNARIISIWCFLYFSFVFLTMNIQTRYFLPFTIMALWLVVQWLDSLSRIRTSVELKDCSKRRKVTQKIINLIVSLLLIIPLLTQIDLVRNHFIERLPYLTGKITREEFIGRQWPGKYAFDKANELASENSKVCIFSLRTYYLSAPYFLPPTEVFSQDLAAEEYLFRLRGRNAGYILIEKRVLAAGMLFNWVSMNSSDSEDSASFNEKELMNAINKFGIPRSLARELLKHQGGRRTKSPDGTWQWVISLKYFRKPAIAGMMKFLASFQELSQKGLIEVSESRGDWELYKIN